MESAKKLVFFLVVLIFISGCKTSKQLPKKINELNTIIETSALFNNGFTGFALYDPQKKKMLGERYADKYFTPASNTKILTCYTALKMLDETPAGLRYQSNKEGITFRGTGNPGFLNDQFLNSTQTSFQFLKKSKKPLSFCACNFMDQRFGSGWSWDDYHYAFQAEKSAFPIYGNTVEFSKKNRQAALVVQPGYFKKNVLEVSKDGKTGIYRKLDENIFEFSGTNGSLRKSRRPFRPTTQTTIELLQDALEIPIKSCDGKCEISAYEQMPGGLSTQDMLRQMMQPSDNFVAEQLLLLCADKLCDTLQVSKAINWSMENLLNELIDHPKWVDGSGLSRYNKITPRSLIEVLDLLRRELPEEELFSIFPAGGESGSIKNWYGGKEKPFVFAKTGSLRHVHCLSGYVKTKSGRTLIFSFMHNNYTCSTKALMLEMEKVLDYVYEVY